MFYVYHVYVQYNYRKFSKPDCCEFLQNVTVPQNDINNTQNDYGTY